MFTPEQQERELVWMGACKNNINMKRYVQKYKIQNEAKAQITRYTYNIQYTRHWKAYHKNFTNKVWKA